MAFKSLMEINFDFASSGIPFGNE